MANKHTITSRDKWFLDKHMKDPVAQEEFRIGDTVVVCAKCKTAHYESTWSMNSGKCCSMGCEHSIQLNFKTFSPVIFQIKNRHSSRFSVIAEKLSFLQRLQMFNGYPLANTVTVLIPIFIIALFFNTSNLQGIKRFNFNNRLSEVKNSFSLLHKENKVKTDRIADKQKNINLEFGDMNYKVDKISSSFENIKPELNQTSIDSKLQKSSKKLSELFNMLAKFFENIFG